MSKKQPEPSVVIPSENLIAILLSKRGCALQSRLYRQQYRALLKNPPRSISTAVMVLACG
jgi:hypothetical protein